MSAFELPTATTTESPRPTAGKYIFPILYKREIIISRLAIYVLDAFNL